MGNYTWPQLEPSPAQPQYPPFTVLTTTPTTVKGGGLTRGVMTTRSVRLLDGFDYLDPNIQCGMHEGWSWSLVQTSGIYQWVARKIGEGNGTLPGPLPATYDPSRTNPNAESYRPCATP